MLHTYILHLAPKNKCLSTLVFTSTYGQITVSPGIAAKKLPSSKLFCIPLTTALLTPAPSSPGSNTTVMVEVANRQFRPWGQLHVLSMMRSMTTGYSSVM